MITAIAVIAWIVYITDANVNQKQLKVLPLAELHKKQTVQAVAVTPSEPKNHIDPDIVSTTTKDAIDRVGLVCCLTTMLFFAAPLSNLVSIIMCTVNCAMCFQVFCLIGAAYFTILVFLITFK